MLFFLNVSYSHAGNGDFHQSQGARKAYTFGLLTLVILNGKGFVASSVCRCTASGTAISKVDKPFSGEYSYPTRSDIAD
jgi:hypothetical protein